MKVARAFSPCHITGFFQIFDNSLNPLYIGSRGAGVSLSSGIETIVAVKKASEVSAEIKINGVVQDSAEVSKQVMNATLSRLKKRDCYSVTIEHCVSVPIGAGFGTSGAAALSLALALNEAFELNMTRIEAAQMAHMAEVECKTGLGTVIAETFGGVEIRTKPGAPGIGEIIQVPVSKNSMVVCLSFGPLSTKESLTNSVTRERVNRFGSDLVGKLVEKPDLAGFLGLSRQFAEHVGLITERVRRVLKATDAAGFACSMTMFGESVFTLVERDSLEDITRIFRKHGLGGVIVSSEIDFEGARLLK
jgi:pantoate kinase